jgi:hypothetical protein
MLQVDLAIVSKAKHGYGFEIEMLLKPNVIKHYNFLKVRVLHSNLHLHNLTQLKISTLDMSLYFNNICRQIIQVWLQYYTQQKNRNVKTMMCKSDCTTFHETNVFDSNFNKSKKENQCPKWGIIAYWSLIHFPCPLTKLILMNFGEGLILNASFHPTISILFLKNLLHDKL